MEYTELLNQLLYDIRTGYNGNQISHMLNFTIVFQLRRHIYAYRIIGRKRNRNLIDQAKYNECYDKILNSTQILVKIILLRNRLHKKYINRIYNFYLLYRKKDIKTISPRKNKMIKTNNVFFSELEFD